jgi:hypothetical protein
MEENKEQQPLGTLFNVLAYNEQQELEQFIQRLESGSDNDIIITVMAAIRYAQAREAYSEEENNVINIALSKITDLSRKNNPIES